MSISMRLYVDGAYLEAHHGWSASEALQRAVEAARDRVRCSGGVVAVRDCLGGLRAEVWADPQVGPVVRRT